MTKSYVVYLQVLQLFLSLKIKEVNKGDKEVENKAARREKLKKMSKRERKVKRVLFTDTRDVCGLNAEIPLTHVYICTRLCT